MTYMKVCSSCKQEKHYTLFSKQAASRDGFHNYCKVCNSVRNKAYVRHTKVPVQDGHKNCKTCNTVKPLDMFTENVLGAGGLYSVCKTCRSTKLQEKLQDKQFRDKVNADSRAYYEDNKESVNKRISEYLSANPHIRRKSVARYRAAKLTATPLWALTSEGKAAIDSIYLGVESCALVGLVAHHVDHIVPLQSEIVCGLHCAANLQVLTATENQSKSNRYWPNMWLDSDFIASSAEAFDEQQGELP